MGFKKTTMGETSHTEGLDIDYRQHPMTAKIVTVKIVLIEEMLGTNSTDMLAKRFTEPVGLAVERHEEEVALLEKTVELMVKDGEDPKGVTIFFRNEEGAPVIPNYMVKGFFKAACEATGRADPSWVLPMYKKAIDTGVFVGPRFIKLQMPEGGEIGRCSRSLRTQVMGKPFDVVALSHSETVPAGTILEFEVYLTQAGMVQYVTHWLKFGAMSGLGQWRNSGKGQFKVIELKVTDGPYKRGEGPNKAAKKKAEDKEGPTTEAGTEAEAE